MENYVRDIKGLNKFDPEGVRFNFERMSWIIPSLQAELEIIEDCAPAGCCIALNVDYGGSEHFMSTFPQTWLHIYLEKGFSQFDPVMLWAAMNNGTLRWSEIKIPDTARVLQSAKEYDLTFGALFVRMAKRKKHVLSVARGDRELSGIEMSRLDDLWDRVTNELSTPTNLSESELSVIRLMAKGESYRDIAGKLTISEPTVKNRVRDIKNKLDARSPAHAVAIALAKGMV